MSRTAFLVAALAIASGGTAQAQMRMASPGDGGTSAQVAALARQVSELQQEVAQLKAAQDKASFDDRFRLTAIELNEKQTFGPAAAQVGSLSNRTTNLENSVNSLASAEGALSAKFAHHTHTYGKTTFAWSAQQMHDLKEAEPTQTSGPNAN